ncbi:MAG: SpoVA/SpoVAEb family sporulation membrane protein [Clostridia bacterium]|nr:SpoVA/SpoVAEb family sporulation membrane protein [Clostridia bacterium]
MTNKQYQEYATKRSETSPCIINCIKAFITGGLICMIGEAFKQLYLYLNIDSDTSLLFASLSIILLTAISTGLGFFDKIARFGKGGALVPISGFANAITSEAIESKSEGLITGVATKMFTIAGPVIIYGITASIIYGLFYYIFIM